MPRFPVRSPLVPLALLVLGACANTTAPVPEAAGAPAMAGVIRSIDVGERIVLALDRTDPAAPDNTSGLADALVAVHPSTEILVLSGGELLPAEASYLHAGDAIEVWHTDSEWLSIPPGYDATRIVITADALTDG